MDALKRIFGVPERNLGTGAQGCTSCRLDVPEGQLDIIDGHFVEVDGHLGVPEGHLPEGYVSPL